MSLNSNMTDTGQLWHGCDIACVVVALRASLDMQLQKLEEEGEESVKVLCADTFETSGGRAHSDPSIMYSLPRATLRALDYIMAQVKGGKPWSKQDYKNGKEVLDDYDSRTGYMPLGDDKLMEIYDADGYTADDDEEEGEDEEGENEASQQGEEEYDDEDEEEYHDVGEEDEDNNDCDYEEEATSNDESESEERDDDDDVEEGDVEEGDVEEGDVEEGDVEEGDEEEGDEEESSFGGRDPSAQQGKRARGSPKRSPSKKKKVKL